MSLKTSISKTAPVGRGLTTSEVDDVVTWMCAESHHRGEKVLLIVPDGTRTAPLGPLFRSLHRELGQATKAFDVMVALGTHPPMTEEAICQRLEICAEQRKGEYRRVRFLNHTWDDPKGLKTVGTLSAADIKKLSGGLFEMEVPVTVNRHLFEYDQVIIIGPVFPHEVVGFSGGNKYLFPGVAGPDIVHFFHWLGAVVTSPKIIGHKNTPVRQVIDRAASLVGVNKLCFCLVVDGNRLAGLHAGAPEAAWDAASNQSRQLHITIKDKPFHTVVSCAPRMYDDLWTGGKCMYKLEPVLANGGELIIYAPHIAETSITHGKTLEEVGYHCRDFFLKQWDRFQRYPWGVLAHSSHVYGVGTFSRGIEKPRARVTLATGIDAQRCQRINLAYRDPKSLKLDEFANRENEGILLVPKAGEILFQLRTPPRWAKGVEKA